MEVQVHRGGHAPHSVGCKTSTLHNTISKKRKIFIGSTRCANHLWLIYSIIYIFFAVRFANFWNRRWY